MGLFTRKEITDIGLLVSSRKDLYKNTKEIRSFFEASKKMYNDDSAFILELIQNADDCEAKNITINVKEEMFRFEHDGRCFDLKDIKQITKASSEDNEKATDEGKIGQFGIGFKSVFNVTSKPMITSGKYRFEINDYVIPKFIVPDIYSESSDFSYLESNRTIIELPFVDSDKYEISKKRLESISDKHILFLNNVVNIKIIIDNEIRIIKKENISKDLFLNNENQKENCELVFKNNAISFVKIINNYYLISSGLILSPSEEQKKFCKNIKIAFEMKKEDEGYNFIPVQESNFNVFFPTNTPTGLNFYIQGKYTVGMNRKELNNANQDFLKDSNNSKVIEITCKILQKTIDIFFDLGLINKELLKIIIQKQEKYTPIGKIIRECIQQYFKNSNKFLLSQQANNIDNILFADDSDIIDIFSPNDIYENCYWVNKNYVEFYSFFSEIEGLKLINLNFIKQKIKSDKLILDKVNNKKLYKYLLKNRNKILDLEFIKTTVGTYEKIDCPLLFFSNDIENLEEIKNEIKDEIGLCFDPLFIDEKIRKEIVHVDKIKRLQYDSVVKFIDEKFFLLSNDYITKVGQYFSGFNIIMKLLKMSRKKIEVKNIPLLTKNGDKGYIKASKENTYFIENQQIKNLYIKAGVLKESDFIDNDVYEKYVSTELKDVFNKFICECEVKKNVIKNDVNECLSYNFFNKNSQKLFDNRQQQEKDSYYCYVYNPTIENAHTIIEYISTKGELEDSKTFFNLMVEFFNSVTYKNPYFDYYYRKWNKIYLEEIDLLTMLKDFKWLFINNIHYKSKQVTFERLKANGYLQGIKDKTALMNLCNLIEINMGCYSKDTAEALRLIEEMDTSSLETIKNKVDTLLDGKIS